MNESKYLKIFISEAEDHISNIGEYLNTLASNPADKDAITGIMGRLHSIKGIASTMGYQSLSKLSHITEDILIPFRDKSSPIDGNTLRLVYEVIDTIEKFKDTLPEINDELINKLSEKIRKKLAGEPVSEESESKEPSENINLSVNEMVSAIDRNIKVHISAIDSLLDQVSELKYMDSSIRRLNETLGSYQLKLILKNSEDQLRKLFLSLLELKMQSFDTIAGKLRRAINEYCLSSGKKIDFVINTNNIMIDSTILMTLVSPLIHLIRNAIDHGIESQEERKRLNKPSTGRVSLMVKKLHDFVEISIQDDGCGLPIELIIEKALKMGIIAKQPDSLDSKTLIYILTRPGFTTREKATLVSGRGLGLDVVRSSLENIGGSISLETQKNIGTNIILKVPVTTAVIKSLIVKTDDDIIAVPSSTIIKVLSVKSNKLTLNNTTKSISFTYEGEQIEVKSLGALLTGVANDFTINAQKDEYRMILMNIRGKLSGVLADEIVAEEELFIKPLTKPLKKMTSVLGYSILGSGSPVFMVDLNFL